MKLANEPDRFLSTIQIGITLIGILTGLYSGEAFAYDLAEHVRRIPFLEPYALGVSKTTIVVIVTYLTLIMGELSPNVSVWAMLSCVDARCQTDEFPFAGRLAFRVAVIQEYGVDRQTDRNRCD